MSRKVLINLIAIIFLLLIFPSLWFYNQRILNYRKFFTLNTNFSINRSKKKREDLSSVTYVIRILEENDILAKLDVKTVDPNEFEVMGRRIITESGALEVYEYSSNEDAVKKLDSFNEMPEIMENTYIYKNLLIHCKCEDENSVNLMKDLFDE